MWKFILIVAVVAVLLALPLLTVGASYFHALGEKRRDEQVKRDAEELRKAR